MERAYSAYKSSCTVLPPRHKEWRKQAKKFRRKRIRSSIAKERDENIAKAEASPRYRAWLEQQAALEEVQAHEEELASQRREQQWLADELRAQQSFKLKQLETAKYDEEMAKKKAELQAEIEARELRKKKEKETKEKEERKMEEEAKEKEKRIEDFLEMGCELPAELRVESETNPSREICPFFSKVAACRFGDLCSRNHKRPSISSCVLLAGMFSHPSLLGQSTTQTDDQQDWGLEFAESEVRVAFEEFFDDVCGELGLLGDLTLLVVSSNSEPHLRGNVYAQFKSERDALKVCRALSGRWYAGKRLQPCFVNIPNWRAAICGLQDRRCPKGHTCNFLHIFRNPAGRLTLSPKRKSRPSQHRDVSVTPVRSSERRESREVRSLSPWSPGRRLTVVTRRSRSPSSWSSRGRSRSPRRDRHRSKSPQFVRRCRKSSSRESHRKGEENERKIRRTPKNIKSKKTKRKHERDNSS